MLLIVTLWYLSFERVCRLIQNRLVLIACVLGLFLVCQTPGMANDDYFYVDSFYGTDTTDPFNGPYGIAVDSRDGYGNVYVVDTNNHRIIKFDKYGNFIPGSIWGGVRGSALGQFDHPEGIAVDSTGVVYVADTINNRIQRRDNVGWTEIIGAGSLNRPVGVAVDNERIYVSDTENSVIKVFNKYNYKLITNGTWGNGLLNQPRGIAVDGSGNLYVMDGGNNKIRVLNSTGSEIRNWSATGYGISLDGSGQLLLAGPTSHMITVSNSLNGEETSVFGSQGSGDMQFQQPRDVAVAQVVGHTSYVYVADTGNNRISIWAPKDATIPPIANFTITNLDAPSKAAPLRIQLNDTSVLTPEGRKPTEWTWSYSADSGSTWNLIGTKKDFNDRNLTHQIHESGIYSFQLTVENNEGVDTKTVLDCITVSEAPTVFFTREGEQEYLKSIDMTPGQTEILSLWLDVPAGSPANDLSGFNITLKLDNKLGAPVSIIDVVKSSAWNPYGFSVSDLPAVTVWCSAADLSGESGTQRIHLLDVTIMAYASGVNQTSLALEETLSPTGRTEYHIADRDGGIYRPKVQNTTIRVAGVHPFPRPSGGFFPLPVPLIKELNGGERFIDLDGNSRIGFNDVVVFWNNMPAIERGDHGAKSYFDYDGNSIITTRDLITLYEQIR